MKDNDRIDIDERFEEMERRISELETLVVRLARPRDKNEKPLGELPKFDWQNALGIATVYDIYSGKTSSRD